MMKVVDRTGDGCVALRIRICIKDVAYSFVFKCFIPIRDVNSDVNLQGQGPGQGLGQLWGIVPTGLFLPVGNASLR